MKTLLSALLLLGSISSYAGVLVNSSNGESITLNFDESSQTLSIISGTELVKDQEIPLTEIDQKKSDIDLLQANNWASKEVYGEPGTGAFRYAIGGKTGLVILSFIIPGLNFPRLGATAIDIVLLPAKAPLKVLNDAKFKKDFRKLQLAINTSGTVEVSNARFKRIAKLLE